MAGQVAGRGASRGGSRGTRRGAGRAAGAPLPWLVGALLVACALAGCEEPPEETDEVAEGPCGAVTQWAELPEEVEETSGVAASRQYPGVFWTHNDSGGDSAVFALDSTGAVLARVRVTGAMNRDWEDIAVGSCSPGEESDCLFIGDIGDNREARERVVVFRVPEPDPGADSVSRPADRIHLAYPDGPRDAEGLFVTAAGIHVVSKGRSSSVDLFRTAGPYSTRRRATPGADTMQRVQRLAPPPTSVSAQVTAAAVSGDSLVVLRSYGGLRFFVVAGDTLRPRGPTADLSGAVQMQGEGVDFIAGDRLVLTGEAGGRSPATLGVVRCEWE